MVSSEIGLYSLTNDCFEDSEYDEATNPRKHFADSNSKNTNDLAGTLFDQLFNAFSNQRFNDTTENMKKFFKGKRIFVTGACGIIGRELVRQLIEEYEREELVGVDNNESELFYLEQRFANYNNVRFFLADVRDRRKL